ncbi:UNVERIFIED_CONTAM: hypothetical protein GTU68_043644 [Idotea baltica]|nr:hypothetical protein [Idotea baltica]
MLSRFFSICAAIFALSATAADHPNVIVILTDDQGWGDLSLNGNTNLSTPHIDSLAADGAMFERFYVCPVCSPTRAEFLTGRYHPRSGVYSTSAGGERMDLDETTIGDVFKSAGYNTGAYGKWHNGMQFPYHPNARGFDDFYGFCSGHWGDYFSPMLEHNNEIVTGEGFCVDDFTNKAMDFMEASGDKPFFVYLPYNTPHSPMQVPVKYWEKFKDKELTMHNREPKKEQDLHLRCALAMCENIDDNVGRVMKKLDDLGKSENTIVVYFCDNGPNGTRWNGDMKGKKGSTDEGGIRSPLLIKWPEKIRKGIVETRAVAAIDLLPTLAELAGIEAATEKPLDGVSVATMLGIGPKKGEWTHRLIFSHWKGKLSTGDGRYRLDGQGALFDLKSDPGQRTNIAKEYPTIAERMQTALTNFNETVVAELPEKDERPFVIGHPDSPVTQVPARDGKAHGGIKRSNKFPNCSFFGNWKSTEDKITWEVEIGETGDYEVEMYYACATADVGSTVTLSCGSEKITTKISKANEVPLRGMENDRFKRAESYVKDFKPMSLGTIHLEKGTGTLTLQATEIPGAEAMEFRLLMLRQK